MPLHRMWIGGEKVKSNNSGWSRCKASSFVLSIRAYTMIWRHLYFVCVWYLRGSCTSRRENGRSKCQSHQARRVIIWSWWWWAMRGRFGTLRKTAPGMFLALSPRLSKFTEESVKTTDAAKTFTWRWRWINNGIIRFRALLPSVYIRHLIDGFQWLVLGGLDFFPFNGMRCAVRDRSSPIHFHFPFAVSNVCRRCDRPFEFAVVCRSTGLLDWSGNYWCRHRCSQHCSINYRLFWGNCFLSLASTYAPRGQKAKQE